MHPTTNLLQNRTKPTQKLQSSNISEQDPNSNHYWNSNNNSNQSTSRQSLKMEIGSKLDKIAGFSTKKLVNGAKNLDKGQENSSQQVNKHLDIKNAINNMKNMPNNIPSSQSASIKPHRVIHSKSKNLSIQIQNPAQNTTTTPNTEPNQTKKNPQPSQPGNMQRSSSNNSIISELELDQIQAYQILDPNRSQEKLIIKICDGLYIGGQDSIWDVDTLALNYISHLIRVNQIQNSQDSKPNSTQSKYKQYKQQYVPQLISYIHSIPYQYKQSSPTPLLQTFKKITQFIQHAHQQGQSCLIISRNLHKECQANKTKRKRKNSKYNTMNTQQNELQRQNDSQQKQKSLYQCLYKPAVIVSGYLMYKYSWSMLKALQFVIARLTAGHKTAQMLLKVSENSTKKQRSNAISQSSHNNMNSLYSQLITHILPQLPHSQNQKVPTIHNLPIKSLQLLQLSMISDSKTLTYGWNKHKQPIGPEQQYILTGRQFSLSTVKQQQLLLTNTYINCMMGSDVNFSYKGLLQEDLHSKSIINLRSYSHNNSMANISSNLNNGSMQIKNNTINIRRSLKALPPSNTNNRSTNSSKQKQTRHSLEINLKKPNPKPNKNSNSSINRSISIPTQKIGQKRIDQLLNNQSNANARAQNINNSNSATSLNLNIVNRNNSQSSLKNKGVPTKRKQVTWSSTLTTSKQQQCCPSIPNKNIPQQKVCQQVQQYAKKLKSAYKISSDPKPTQNISKLHNRSIPQTQNNININNIIPNKSIKNNVEELEKKNDYFNCQAKNKIVINVMSMIGNKNNRLSENNTERQQTRLSNLNRKSKLYQSKARLPTIYDVLNANLNTINNTKTNTVNNSMVNSYIAKKEPQHIQSLNQGLIDVAYICSEGNEQKRKNRISLDDRCISMNTQQNQLTKKHIYTEQPFQQEQEEYQQSEEQKYNKSLKNNDPRHPQKNKVIAQTINKLKEIKNNRMDNQYQCFKIKNKNISSSTHSITSNTGKNRNIYGNIQN